MALNLVYGVDWLVKTKKTKATYAVLSFYLESII